MPRRHFRTFGDGTGNRFRVIIAPREMRGGVCRSLSSLVFLTTEGEWVGSVAIYSTITLESLSRRELLTYLDKALWLSRDDTGR